MKPFTVLNGGCVLMPYENIDTDQLIPARFMNRTRASGYGGYLFYDLRYNAMADIFFMICAITPPGDRYLSLS